MSVQRTMGLFGATAVGVGSIVGGGILALAGVAFAEAGPAAILAFALNGGIAFLTALSFAELGTRFPESGGTYAYARKVLTVEAAFIIGWIFWFALIASAVLYAVGFAFFALMAVENVWAALAAPHAAPAWLSGRLPVAVLAIAATCIYAATFTRRAEGGGPWINVGKVLIYSVLIAGGLWMIVRDPQVRIMERLTPFFSEGWLGVVHAMGLTFITLHGFDLVAAVGGEIKSPEKTIPRAMLLSLLIALLIYIPVLFVSAVAGLAPGETLAEASHRDPEAFVARAAQQFLGGFGYWLVISAAVLSMLSALQANLFAATRVGYAMARDRNLPHSMQHVDARRGTPVVSIIVTTLIVLLMIMAIPDVAASGAAASLIFLITFALTHWISVLARMRGTRRPGVFMMPLFPVVPILGGVTCVALSIFEGVVVPVAGAITAVWLVIGAVLFMSLFARRARVVDASSQARDPQLVRLRGRSPLVLVPIANPAHAEAMVEVASALAPPQVGRVLLLCVVSAPKGWDDEQTPRALTNAQHVLKEALTASFPSGLAPEALTTVAEEPWAEITRIAQVHRCESLLLGLSRLEDEVGGAPLETLIGSTESDVVVLRSTAGWKLENVERVIVPVGGRGGHDELRARLLGSLHRLGARTITFVRILGSKASEEEVARARRELFRVAMDESPGQSNVDVIRGDDIVAALVEYAAEDDLLVMGMQRLARRRTAFGSVALDLARRSPNPLILISRRG